MSKNIGNLEAQLRAGAGKGVARKLRATGRIPAVVYGQGGENVKVSINPLALRSAMDPERKLNTFWSIDLQDDAGKSAGAETCIIVDYQLDILRDEFIHIDFMRVSKEEDVTVTIPVVYTGKAIGTVTGGKLRTLRRSVKVAVKPSEIPVNVSIDVTNIESGDSLRLKEISLEGIRLLDHPEMVMALVEAPRGAREDANQDAENPETAEKK
jgi:large subunit ribosomal protein L25